MNELYDDILNQIKSNQSLCENIEFMRKAIMVDERFIVFDRTQSDEVYLAYVEKKIEKLKQDSERYQGLIEVFDKIAEELRRPKQVDAGKYKIPHKYLFERIIRSEKEGELPARFDLNQYFELDGQYDETFGKELEELYDDPNYVFGMHGTSSIIKVDDINRVMSEGLRATTQGMGPGHLASHVYYGDNIDFLQAISFIRNNPNLSETIFVLKIPRGVFDKDNPEPLYGSNSMVLDHNAYLLPQYIYGYIHRKSAFECENLQQQLYDRTICGNDQTPIRYKFGFHEITIDENREPVTLIANPKKEDKII